MFTKYLNENIKKADEKADVKKVLRKVYLNGFVFLYIHTVVLNYRGVHQ